MTSNIDFQDFKDLAAFINAVLGIAAPNKIPISSKSANYTLQTADANGLIIMNNEANFTIPAGQFGIGDVIALTKSVDATVQINAGSGVSIVETQDPDVIPGKYVFVAALRLPGTSPEVWALGGAGIGDISELLAQKANKTGDAGQTFSVGTATSSTHAVRFGQMNARLDEKAELAGSSTQVFSVGEATSANHAVRLSQAEALGAGLSEVDMWKLNTTSVSSLSNGGAFLNANFIRFDNTAFARKGSGMTFNSGIFTFPSTGLWKLTFGARFALSDDDFDQATRFSVYNTINNNDYARYATAYGNIGKGDENINTGVAGGTLINITSVTNHKVRLHAQTGHANTLLRGGNSVTDNWTWIIFEKVG